MSVPTVDGIPVLLPKHSHPSFGDPREHYHIDFRYHPDKPEQDEVVFSDSPVIYKDLPLVRESYRVFAKSTYLPIWLAGKYLMEGTSGVCPHKGLPLVDIGGGVKQCVGHGLCFKDCFSIAALYLNPGIGVRQLVKFKQQLYEFACDRHVSSCGLTIETDEGVCVGYMSMMPTSLCPGDKLRLTVK